jgi:hypothetical protein
MLAIILSDKEYERTPLAQNNPAQQGTEVQKAPGGPQF